MASLAIARTGRRLLVCMAASSCLLLMSCGGPATSTPEVPDEPLSGDESVLKALEPYDPIYKLNYSGRVVALKLEGRRIPASVLEEVSKLTELSELSLYAAALTDDSLAWLGNLKNLQSLGLGATPIKDKALVHLHGLSALRWIWLNKELVQPEYSKGVKDLLEALPGLTVYPQ